MRKSKQLFLLPMLAILLLLFGCFNPDTSSDKATGESELTTTADQNTNRHDHSEQTPSDSLNEDNPDDTNGDTVKIPEGYGGISTLCLKNLADTHAVQQIAFYKENNTTYIFVTQRSKSTTYLSRCLVNEETKTATMVDYAVLEGYGHGDSLDVTVHNGQVYLMIGSDAGSSTTKYWPTTITRLRYDAGQISEVKKITDIHCASKNGSNLRGEDGITYRINFGMDDEADILAIYVSVATTENPKKVTGYHHITAYKLSDIHNALDSAVDSISLADCTDAFLATTGSVGMTKIFSNASCQGIDVDSNGTIYVTGGATDNLPQLGILKIEDSLIFRKELKDIDFIISEWLGMRDFRQSETYIEIESIKYFNGSYYCVFNPGGDMKKNYTEVYLLTDH